MIGIIDLSIGNIKSLFEVVKRIDEHIIICNSPRQLNKVNKIIMPGQGAFGAFMQKLKKKNFEHELLDNILNKKKPFLGICVGMQVLVEKGYEYGSHIGLGIIKGKCRKIRSKKLNLPHIGWNNLKVTKKNIFKNLKNNSDCYFAHSNIVTNIDKNLIIAQSNYGENFPSIIQKKNIYGVQFHPEKSQIAGYSVLKNFINNA